MGWGFPGIPSGVRCAPLEVEGFCSFLSNLSLALTGGMESATSVSGFRSGVDRRDYIGLRIVRRLETLGGSIRSPGGSRLAGTCLHPSVAFPFAVSDGTVCGRGPSGVDGRGGTDRRSRRWCRRARGRSGRLSPGGSTRHRRWTGIGCALPWRCAPWPLRGRTPSGSPVKRWRPG